MNRLDRLRHGHTVATLHFGLIHRLVSSAAKCFHCVTMYRINRDTHADGQWHRVARLQRYRGVTYPLAQTLGGVPGTLHIHFGQYNNEFLATKPTDRIDTSYPVGQDLTHRTEHGIPGGVAPAVIDVLEVININP